MTIHQANGSVLRGALIANAAFSLLCGAACVGAANAIAGALFAPDCLGLPVVAGLAALGVGLALFGVAVFWMGVRARISRIAVNAIIALDLGWVAASGLALVFADAVLTETGRWTIGALALVVLCFALAQTLGLAMLYQGASAFQSERRGRVRRLRVVREVAAPAATAWAVMVDHEAYASVAENLVGVDILEGAGEGMRRKCYGADGASWTETAHLWEEGVRYGFRTDTGAPDYPYPLERLAAVWSVAERGARRCAVAIEFEAQPSHGLKGALFMAVSMLTFPKLLDRLLGQWAARMEGGVRSRAEEPAARSPVQG